MLLQKLKGTLRTPKSSSENTYYHVLENYDLDFTRMWVNKFAWLHVIYSENHKQWVNASTLQPVPYTNFKPGIVRAENETCAAISLGTLDQKHSFDYPGYWYPMHCNDTKRVQWFICEQSRETSKIASFYLQRNCRSMLCNSYCSSSCEKVLALSNDCDYSC